MERDLIVEAQHVAQRLHGGMARAAAELYGKGVANGSIGTKKEALREKARSLIDGDRVTTKLGKIGGQ